MGSRPHYEQVAPSVQREQQADDMRTARSELKDNAAMFLADLSSISQHLQLRRWDDRATERVRKI